MLSFHLLLEYCLKHIALNTRSGQVKLEQIPGGSVNQSYCLTAGNKRFLVKQFAGKRWVPVNRRELLEIQTRLAKRGCAPMPLHLSNNNKIYLEQWIEFNVKSYDIKDKIDILASSLQRIHSLDVHDFLSSVDESKQSGLSYDQTIKQYTLNLPSHWQKYLKNIPDPEKKWAKKADEYKQVWRDYVKRYQSDFVLCHNDLSIEHVLDDTGMFLDWEYVSAGCRFFDLLTCILANQFDQGQADDLIRRYIELSDYHRSEVHQRVAILQPLVIFTHQLWWRASQAR
ncbi:phosphotransferase [Ningiella sp. W23]|uniref:phosphotransferase n=1 Tax=Ningiella sp. W23 TaxID=3023715 RepID=UPI0037569DD0